MAEVGSARAAATIPLPQIRGIELDLLLEIRRVCELFGLGYVLGYGTLWGAVVEHGFLRDDDDIDVVLPRSDYEVLLRRFDEVCSPGYRILSLETCPGYFYSFAKVTDARTRLHERGLPEIPELGVNVDVFPLDGVPDGRLAFTLHSVRLSLLLNVRCHALTIIAGRGRKTAPATATTPARRFAQFLARRYDTVSHTRTMNRGRWVSLSVGGRIERAVFDDCVWVEFEGHRFSAPAGYDRYLARLYGDYARVAALLGSEPAHGLRATWRRPEEAARAASHHLSGQEDDDGIEPGERGGNQAPLPRE